MTSSETEHEENAPKTSEAESFLPDHEITGNEDEAADSKHENLKDYSLLKRLEVDKPYRRRFIHTVWLFWAFIGLGLMVGQMGPSFPDLQYIVGKDLDVASWLFTIFSFGYLIGSLAGGILYDRFNKLLLIFFSVIFLAVGSAIVPWCSSFPLMLAIRFISGLGAGGLDTGGNADLVSLWDEEGRPFMQALHFCFGFGGIISPLITEPFLVRKECLPVSENTTNIYLPNNGSVIELSTQLSLNTSTSPPCQEVFGEVRVQYAYLITCSIALSSAVPFLIMYINSLRHKSPRDMHADKSNQKRPQKLPLKLKITFLILLTIMMMMYCAVEDTFSGFLMTFCLQYLKWSKQRGSYATSIHWAAFSVGRFSGIFLVKILSPVQLLFGFCIMLICSFIGFFIVSITMTTSLIWVFVPLAGFSMSVIFPCIFTWTEESILEVTGMISSFFLISASTGLLLNPLFLGYLMENFAPITFTYLLMAESYTVFGMFLITFFLVRKFIKPRRQQEIETEMNSI